MRKSKAATLFLAVSFLFQMLAGFQMPAYALSAPQLTASAVSETQVSLSWTPIAGSDTYQLWRNVNDNSGYDLLTIQSETDYSDSDITENNKYKYKVIAVAGAVYSNPSNIETVYSDITPPTKPSNLQASSTVNSVTLNWVGSTDGWGVENYKVYGRTEGREYTLLGSPTSTTFVHSGLTSNTSYYYYVKAVDRAKLESGDPEPNEIVNILTGSDIEPPQAPTVNAPSVISDTRIDLAWNQPSDNVGVVSYVVYRSAANTDGNYTEYPPTSSRSYSFTGLSSGAKYYFKVKAKDAAGNISVFSTVVSATTQSDTTKPAPPSIWARASSRTRVVLTWTGATDNKVVTGYDIYRLKSSSGTPTTLIATDTATPFEDTGVTGDSTYRYLIKAKDAAGNISDASNIVNVTTNGDTQEPSEPDNLTLSLTSETQVKLTWSSSTDNKSVTGYKIYRALESGSYTWIASTGSGTTSYNNSGLTADKTYRYYVTAYDAAGNESDESNDEAIDTSDTSSGSGSDQEAIDPDEGGTIEIPDKVKLEIPQDALGRTADYKMVTKSFSSYSASGYKTFGLPVEITCKAGSSNITSFDEDLTLTFYYTSTQLGSTNTSKLDIYYWDDTNDVWVAVPSSLSASSRRVTADIDHLTVFALLADTSTPSVPTLNNSTTSSSQTINLTGRAEKNAKVEISLNGSIITTNADLKGTFSKQVTLMSGINEIKLRATDAAGNQSSWSSVYTISYGSQYDLSDIRGHWAESNIRKAVQKGITSGYDDKTFRPNRTVTRAEFCKFVVSALGYTPVSSPQFSFKDKSSIPTWAKGFVARAVEKKLISGYDDGTFKANQQITRQEMASILVRAMNLQSEADAQKNSHISFDDAEWIPRWARGAVVVAVDQGIINGYSDNTFGPGKSATRAEAVTMIIKMLDRI